MDDGEKGGISFWLKGKDGRSVPLSQGIGTASTTSVKVNAHCGSNSSSGAEMSDTSLTCVLDQPIYLSYHRSTSDHAGFNNVLSNSEVPSELGKDRARPDLGSERRGDVRTLLSDGKERTYHAVFAPGGSLDRCSGGTIIRADAYQHPHHYHIDSYCLGTAARRGPVLKGRDPNTSHEYHHGP